VFLTTSINFCYTVEVNYHYYYAKDEKKERKKYKIKISDFESMGRALIFGVLEYCALRKKSVLADSKY